MTREFSTKIDKFTADTDGKIMAVVKTAILDVVDDMQKPVGQGGKMRVDTGFLRWSGVASIGQVPSGQTRGRSRKAGEVGPLPEYQKDVGSDLNLVVTRLQKGDTFYFGWTARYAEYREVVDGFVESAAQKWQSFVDAAVAKLKGRR